MAIALAPTLQQDSDAHQRNRLQALYHLAVELSTLRDLQSVMDIALGHCLDLTESQFGFIGLNTADGKAMDVVAIRGFHPTTEFYDQSHVIPLRPNVFARVVLENRQVRSEDAMADPLRVGQPRGHPPVHTFLGVPLRGRESPIGMIGVANRPTPYDDDHEQLLVTYAAQVAIAIRNAQLYEELQAAKAGLERKVADRTQALQEAQEALAQKAEQLRQLLADTVNVQERERQRISQDMHDGLNQLLIGALLELKSGRERLRGDELALAEASLEQVAEVLRRMEREIKQIIYDLRPPSLDALGLVPSLRRYAERFAQYTGIPCVVQASGEAVRLPPDMEIGLYRIMQEALQNVSVHAGACRAEVAVGFTPSAVTLSVADDGRGFDPNDTRRDGVGLLGMRERAEGLGGRLTIHTAPGQGTRVNLTAPIHHAGEEGRDG
ncbi:MAG: GAF domain-containing sensor histidine kinase [Chloroflexi bacterium]|nr:GAF domain-containing sensor histidine kinase [Chloroflexota bacterium]